jgi:hypothetical protein
MISLALIWPTLRDEDKPAVFKKAVLGRISGGVSKDSMQGQKGKD